MRYRKREHLQLPWQVPNDPGILHGGSHGLQRRYQARKRPPEVDPGQDRKQLERQLGR